MYLIKNKDALGMYLKQLREDEGASLRDVARVTKTNITSLSRLERGLVNRLPAPKVLQSLASYYTVSLKAIVKKAGYNYAEDPSQEEQIKIRLKRNIIEIHKKLNVCRKLLGGLLVALLCFSSMNDFLNTITCGIVPLTPPVPYMEILEPDGFEVVDKSGAVVDTYRSYQSIDMY